MSRSLEASTGVSQKDFLVQKSEWVWKQLLLMAAQAPEIRVASSLSAVEILVALYYGGAARVFPAEPFHPGRDRCIMSKGHGSLALYPILADLGFFNISELSLLGKKGAMMGGIPDPVVPGYETINGSLGHGLGVGTGMALALRMKRSDSKVFVLVGDGELQEGSCWEALSYASSQQLGNIIVIVDNNAISMLGPTKYVSCNTSQLKERLSAFGAQVFEVNGHNVSDVSNLLLSLSNPKLSRPIVILANTVKGNRVPSLANKPLSHVMGLSSVEIERLLGDTK
jgi:transketolase